jgi:methyl-accepting chemotaxis protein
MLAKLKIRTWLLLLLGVFALALWWAAAQAWFDARQAADAVGEINRLSITEIEPLHETQRLLLATLVNMDNAYINLQRGNQITATNYTRKASALRLQATRVFNSWREKVSIDDTAKDDVQHITMAYGSYAKVLDQREEALYDVSLSDYVAATSGAEQADAIFQSTLHDVISASQARRDALKVQSDARAEWDGGIAMALLALSVFLILAYWSLVNHVLLRPLSDVSRKFQHIASGDLSIPIEGNNRNEIGSLLKALNSMQSDLVRTVAIIRQSTNDVSGGIQGINGDNRELSRRTEQQATALEQVSITLEQLASAVRQNASNARHSDELARTAKLDAVRGSEIVLRVAATMDAVSSSADRISEVVSIIDSIAFQTNILSLNAAVEAARAGEHGKGFAIVATEVRSLASRSAQAAKEVKRLIEESNQWVQSGAGQVVEARNAMSQIVSSAERVTETMNKIALATSEQSDAIAQVSRVVVELDGATQQNTALVERTASAASALEDEAGRLVDAVSVFQIRDGVRSVNERAGVRLRIVGASPDDSMESSH